MNTWIVNRPAVLLLMVFLLGLGLRLTNLGQESLWADEYYSLVTPGRTPTLSEIRQQAHDQSVQAPYYILLHSFLRLTGRSDDTAIRLPSALLGALAPLLFYLLLGLLFPGRRGIALLGATLMALSPMHLCYSQEARFYALLIDVELLALAALVKGLRQLEAQGWRSAWMQSKWLAASAVLICLAVEIHIYTIFAWAAFLGVYLWSALGRRLISRKAFCLLALIMAPGLIRPTLSFIDRFLTPNHFQDFLPESYDLSLLFHVGRAQFLGPHWSLLPGGLQWAGLLAGTGLLIHGLVVLQRRRPKDPIPAIILGAGLAMTLAAPVLISFVRPIVYYGQRYLIIALPFTLALLCANFAPAGNRPRLRRTTALLTGLLCLFLVGLQAAYLWPYYAYRQKHTWDTVATHLTEQVGPEDKIYVIPNRNAGLLAHYMPGRAPIVRENPSRETLHPGTGRQVFIVSYKDLRGWLTRMGVNDPVQLMVFETHQPMQELWVHVINATSPPNAAHARPSATMITPASPGG